MFETTSQLYLQVSMLADTFLHKSVLNTTLLTFTCTCFVAVELELFKSASFKLSLLKLLYMALSWSAKVT